MLSSPTCGIEGERDGEVKYILLIQTYSGETSVSLHTSNMMLDTKSRWLASNHSLWKTIRLRTSGCRLGSFTMIFVSFRRKLETNWSLEKQK